MTTTETAITAIPTPDDLAPLIDAAKEYLRLDLEAFEDWIARKEDYFREHGESHDHGPAADYAYKHRNHALKKRAEDARAGYHSLDKWIEERFPGFRVYGVGIYGTPEMYDGQVCSAIRDYADRFWRQENYRKTDADYRLARKLRPPQSIAAGDHLIIDKSDVAEVLRVSPTGAKITARSLMSGEEIILRPSDSRRLLAVSKAFARRLVKRQKDRLAFIARHVAPFHREGGG